MNRNQREVFIRVQNIKEIVGILEQIEESQNIVKALIPKIEEVKQKEELILNNWMNHLEEIDEKVEHLTL
ncbi:MAG: hypothetical protein LAT82_01725 [Nanoarchaeota archaeon]|nr:hypothetical protein [Nanoarchaeota archaeon]